jgi:mannose-6-phosphate isomerase-like protein (cupin superfamily)
MLTRIAGNGLRIRRVVTGVDAAGHSVVVSDTIAPRFHDFASIPGMSETLIWATGPGEPIPATPTDTTLETRSLVAAPGATQLKIVRFPPDSVFADPSFDPAAAAIEQATAQPGLAELFEPDAPGMHRTPTIDYALVVEGEITLELDDGVLVPIARGEVVVQNGTRHAWRNLTSEPATVAFFVVGSGD